jgi:signal transduction histidine kinase
MNEITDFFKGLFDTDLWPPRWRCGYWSDFHGWLYIVSDLMIWTAYFLIPAIILSYTSKKSPGLKFPKVYFLFAAFILLCGITHFLDAVMFWVPMYRFNALVRFITGIVSLFTVFHMVNILPSVFKQKTNIELEKEIARREEAERRLAEANQGLEAFAYMASHDLKAPLRKIRTYSSMLGARNKDHFDERSSELSQKIMRSSQNMHNIIESILSLSTINGEVELTDVDIEEVVKEVKEELEISLLEKNAVVNVGPIPAVKGNKGYLIQLFSNLISNAAKFSERAPVINISAEQKRDTVIIYLSDNGIGMPKAAAERIFEPFYRLVSKSKYEGTGIGLSICKKIVDVHHGTIGVESVEGEGTTFTIELPSANKESIKNPAKVIGAS